MRWRRPATDCQVYAPHNWQASIWYQNSGTIPSSTFHDFMLIKSLVVYSKMRFQCSRPMWPWKPLVRFLIQNANSGLCTCVRYKIIVSFLYLHWRLKQARHTWTFHASWPSPSHKLNVEVVEPIVVVLYYGKLRPVRWRSNTQRTDLIMERQEASDLTYLQRTGRHRCNSCGFKRIQNA